MCSTTSKHPGNLGLSVEDLGNGQVKISTETLCTILDIPELLDQLNLLDVTLLELLTHLESCTLEDVLNQIKNYKGKLLDKK